jgi:TonB-linked SusC/RagA family outer membrane protein
MKKFLLLKKFVIIPSCLFIWLSVFSMQNAISQMVSGTIISVEDQTPLPGVNIMIKGTTSGTVTDLNGSFSINAGSDATLVFSYVGFESQEIQVGGRTVINVVLQVERELIDELVVIGYGTVKKDDLTGSVAVVTAEDLNRSPASDFGKALQGKTTGVLVTQSGDPRSGATLRVRGIGSINSDDSPLIVIDGIISGKITSIAPEDIETVQVLKDASASAIYGANGANGVIIITTKRGKPGKIDVSLSAYGKINRKPKYYDLMNANEYAAFYDTLLVTNGQRPELAYSDGFRQFYYGEGWEEGTDWQKEILQKSYTQNYYFRVSGGNENSNYSFSSNYYDESGILRQVGAKRISIHANSDFKIGKILRIGETVNIDRRTTSGTGGQWGESLIDSPLMKVYNKNNKEGYEGSQIAFLYAIPEELKSIYGVLEDTVAVRNTGYNDKFNPVALLDVTDSKSYTNSILANIYLELKPFDWLTYRISPSVDAGFSRSRSWTPSYDLGVRSVPRANLDVNFSEGMTLSLENQITFNKSFAKHNFTATAVNHIRKGQWDDASVTAPGFIYEQLPVIGQSDYASRVALGGTSTSTDNSYLGRLIYDYDSKYLLTASIRRDGSSNFGPENKWGTFPSFSFAWKLNQDLLPNVEQISMLKLRFGWGKTGNARIGSFRYQNLLGRQDEFSPVFGINQTVAPALNEMYIVGNPLIKWESAAMTNFGVDLIAYNGKLQFSGEYYYKKQDDLLMQVPITWTLAKVSGGSVGMPWYNIGKIHNTGFEFSATYRKMEGEFNYNISGNLTTVKNIVDDIPDEILNGNVTTREGNTIRSLYAYVAEGIIQEDDFDENGIYKYAKPSQGDPQPGDLRFKDLNRDGIINDLDQTIIGKSLPDLTYSLSVDLYYKNLDFMVFCYGIQNAQIISGLRRNNQSLSVQDLHHNKEREFAENYYKPGSPSTEFIRADLNDKNLNSRNSTWWLEEASYLRIKDIQLGYSIPLAATHYLGIERARIYLSALNLLTITKYTGNDPESAINSGGFDDGAYPLPRSFTAGIQIDF